MVDIWQHFVISKFIIKRKMVIGISKSHFKKKIALIYLFKKNKNTKRQNFYMFIIVYDMILSKII